jgi:hypothetical protein
MKNISFGELKPVFWRAPGVSDGGAVDHVLRARGFMAKNSDGVSVDGFFSLAFSRRVVPRAVRIAFIVGTILALINHGDKILSMSLSNQDLLRVILTYLVPYGVSTWSAVRAIEANAPTST